MEEEDFSELAYRMWENVPSPFKERIRNVALCIEDETEEDLLGLYQGIPLTERGEGYGIGMTLPDTITLYRLPILAEAAEDIKDGESEADAIHRVVAETLWHEVGHYFGLSEEEIHRREEEGTNVFKVRQ